MNGVDTNADTGVAEVIGRENGVLEAFLVRADQQHIDGLFSKLPCMAQLQVFNIQDSI